MAWEALNDCVTRSPLRGERYSVHLSIADTVNPEHEWKWFGSIPRLADKARVSESTARRAIADLVAAKVLELLYVVPGGPSVYRYHLGVTPITYDSRWRVDNDGQPVGKLWKEATATPVTVTGPPVTVTEGGSHRDRVTRRGTRSDNRAASASVDGDKPIRSGCEECEGDGVVLEPVEGTDNEYLARPCLVCR